MGAINPKKVARKVSETIAKGELVDLGAIILDSGYSEATSRSPSLVTNTKSYKAELELATRPLIDGIQSEISRIKDAIKQKDLSKEEYRILVGSLDILTKNHNLLISSTSSTIQIILTEEQKSNLRNILNE